MDNPILDSMFSKIDAMASVVPQKRWSVANIFLVAIFLQYEINLMVLLFLSAKTKRFF
jgi:hypothetical protein